MPSTGTWNLYTWKAAQWVEQLDTSPLENWVWNEGRPADIPFFDGIRVVLAGAATIQRRWNTQRTFGALGAALRLERELDAPEASALFERIQRAPGG